MSRRWLLPLLLTFLLVRLDAQMDRFIRADRLGITHISSVSDITSPDRYRQALSLGAGWNRWPLYWNRVETDTGTWDWSDYDRQVRDDRQHGLQINAILLGRPEFYADGNRIQGLYEPVFSDGSDRPGEDKTINPDNPWASFVYAAVSRYSAEIQIWEVWNEPDFIGFWRGSVNDYARLLKTAYLAAKSANPDATVMFGGLTYITPDNWLAQVLAIYLNDPQAEDFNYYMDIVAVHNYGDVWRSGWLVRYAIDTLRAYDLKRPVWLNESGVPVWDDYPGPIWDPASKDRASLEQQAWFAIQSTAYAFAEGAEKVFFHQLYDDCGDQPAGTDFPPHNGGLCTDDTLCFGDAHGIYRNLPDSTCFSQHQQPGSARPVAEAYRLLAQIFGAEAFEGLGRDYLDEQFVTVSFRRSQTDARITVMWNRTTEAATLSLPASGSSGQLISLDGTATAIPGEDGSYRIPLPPALEDIDRSGDPGGGMAIGGPPYILLESAAPVEIPTVVAPVIVTESPVPTRIPLRPTVDPVLDTQPPTATVLALPAISEPVFTVSWRGEDNSGIAGYVIFVRTDGGTWQPWVDTTNRSAGVLVTSADYAASPGRTYEFAAWAVDLAGNWSTNVSLEPQAITHVD
jgi:hypothetical protein